MTIQKAIKLLEEKYEWAKRQDFIRNPLAYALYQIWKQADGERRDGE